MTLRKEAHMSRIRFILCCGLLALFATSVAAANSIVKIRVDDTIQPITAEYIDRAIEHARQTNADAVLIELSTPGGLLDSTRTIKIGVDDTIQPITAEYIDRAIEHARQTNADAVLIELSTPGGLLDSTRTIIQTILASPVPVIIYVAPSGARAASAGFFILEAADVAAMAPGTNTGAAHPVTLGGEKMDD